MLPASLLAAASLANSLEVYGKEVWPCHCSAILSLHPCGHHTGEEAYSIGMCLPCLALMRISCLWLCLH